MMLSSGEAIVKEHPDHLMDVEMSQWWPPG